MPSPYANGWQGNELYPIFGWKATTLEEEQVKDSTHHRSERFQAEQLLHQDVKTRNHEQAALLKVSHALKLVRWERSSK
jgi:hypothetical protein